MPAGLETIEFRALAYRTSTSSAVSYDGVADWLRFRRLSVARQKECKDSTMAGLSLSGFDPKNTPMSLNNLFAYPQSQARSLRAFRRKERLENLG